jgi:hypothetical protein
LCGAIINELVSGDTAYLFYNTSSRVFTLWPKSTAYQATHNHTLRIRPTNASYQTNNIVDLAFTATGTAPCSNVSYTANRQSIVPQAAAYPNYTHTGVPGQERYNINYDGTKNMPFTFDMGNSSCHSNYFKEYTVVVTKLGATVASPAWLSLDSHQTSPSLTVSTSSVSHYGTYIVTVSTTLYAEYATKSFTFEILLTPC